MSDPSIHPQKKAALVAELMSARRAVKEAKNAGDFDSEVEARRKVDQLKRELGERGPVWWKDAAPDFNRHAVKNSPYSEWYAKVRRHG